MVVVMLNDDSYDTKDKYTMEYCCHAINFLFKKNQDWSCSTENWMEDNKRMYVLLRHINKILNENIKVGQC
jgi:hypothetical protein